ncbi:alpha/beta-hydrolase [Stipitochalara longipes BDJ]|nr:alpha/beta-hydrolase [Stipitochalara longipes BDJ]
MEKPTIVMVPGAWHKATIYSPTSSILKTHGYPTILLDLPSVGAVPPHTSFDHDVSAIRDCLTSLISQDKDVVLVAWSYGGFPAGEAPKGFSKKERQAKGLQGGVIRFVVINGVAMPAGYQPHTNGDYASMPEWVEKDIPNNTGIVLPSSAKRVFYQDMPTAQADTLSTQLLHQSLGVFFSTSTYAAFEDIPSTFLSSGADLTPFGQLNGVMLEYCRQSVPGAFDVVEHCEEAGHAVMASQPEWTADALRRAAGEKF